MSLCIPNDFEAERGVIANLLNAQDNAELAERMGLCTGDGIGQDHLSDPELKRVWDSVRQAAKDSEAIELVGIAKRANVGLGYLASLQGEHSTSIDFRPLRDRVKKAYIARELAVLGQNVSDAHQRQDFDPGQFLGQMDRIRELATSKSLTSQLKDSLLSGDQLADLKVIPRECFLGSWLREGSLGFLFGLRGIGKTWFSLGIARAIAEGAAFGPWKAGKPQRVTYIDGEMPLESMQQRDAALRDGSAPIHFLNHERFFEVTGKSLNLANRETQEAVTKLILETKTRVLLLDNLSCLFSSVKENDADEWEKILPWLLSLRRHRIAVVILHHSGRSGTHMRGTSRREDAAFWVIQLCEPSAGSDGNGLKFISLFSKNRDGTAEETQTFEWTFETCANGNIAVSHRRISALDQLRQWLRDGMTTCADIAEAMGLSKPTVSKLAAKAIREGWLKKNGRDYELLEPV